MLRGAGRREEGAEVLKDFSQKEKSAAEFRCAPEVNRKLLVVVIVVVWAVAVVIVLVPITICVPFPAVFIPPAMAVFPAPFPRDFQFRTLRFGLGTVPAMLCSGSVKFVIDANDSPLTVSLVGAGVRRTKKKCGANQRGA
jgi:hypothetical protein